MPIGIILGVTARKRRKFFSKIERKHNLEYKGDFEIDLMRGFKSRLFNYNRTVSSKDVFEGNYNNHKFHLFVKRFYTGWRSTNKFTVLCAQFGDTQFPHILLKSKNTPLYQKVEKTDNKIFLEENFLRDFDLYCSAEYEIEVLQIFTKELLNSIQQISGQLSFEFGGNKIYIYLNKDIYSDRNEKNIEVIISLVQQIVDKTDGLLFRLKDDFAVLRDLKK